MRYVTAAAFRAALEERLKQQTRGQDPDSLVRLRKQIVFDRLLARLLQIAPDRWLVKGGFALDLRLGTRARTTKDLDLVRQDDQEQATDDLLAVADTDLGDFFRFTIERTGAFDHGAGGEAVRYRVRADLAGRTFEDVTLDIGFGDAPPLSADRLPGTDFLGFAGVPRLEVPALPLEQHLAEKLHAYTRTYGNGHSSSRVKDLVDLVLILSLSSFLAGRIAAEVRRTFTTRGTHQPPTALPEPPQDWVTPFRALAQEVGLDPGIGEGFRLAAGFLDPVLSGLVADAATWEPLTKQWSIP